MASRRGWEGRNAQRNSFRTSNKSCALAAQIRIPMERSTGTNYRRFGSRRYVCCAVVGTNAVIVVGGVEDDEMVGGKGVENTREIVAFIALVQVR